MQRIDELRDEILRLDPTGQRELFSFLADQVCGRSSLPPGIESSPDVCGGEPRIIRTRIPVWVLEQMRRLGMSEAEILRSYPTLRAEDLVHAWAYVDLHRDEIDHQIAENEEA